MDGFSKTVTVLGKLPIVGLYDSFLRERGHKLIEHGEKIVRSNFGSNYNDLRVMDSWVGNRQRFGDFVASERIHCIASTSATHRPSRASE